MRALKALIICCLSLTAYLADAKEQGSEYQTITISPKMDEVILKDNFGEDTLTVQTIDDFNLRLKSFNESAQALGLKGKIESCDTLIDIPGGMNHSYGAFCTLLQGKKRIPIQVCNDDMVGDFALNHPYRNEMDKTKNDLIMFVVSNCLGG